MKQLKIRLRAMWVSVLLVAVMALSAGCSSEAEQEEFDAYLKETFENEVTTDTLTLHYTLADPEGYGIERPEATFGEVDFSEEGLQEEKKELEDALRELKSFHYDRLTPEQRFTYEILLDKMQINLESYDYIDYYEPFAYTSGLQANLPITMSNYKFYNAQDVEDYLALLEQIPEYFQSFLDFEKSKSEKGLFMSDGCAEEVIRQCSDYIAAKEDNLLIETFDDRIGDVEGLSADQIEAYKKANREAVIQSVIPAYENVIQTFNELKGSGQSELGLAHLEGGKEYYQYLLKSDVGTDKTPEEVIQLLESAMGKEILQLQRLVVADPDVYNRYAENYDTLYEEDLDPKETIEYFEELIEGKFPEIPDIDFTVTPVHQSLEDSVSPAFFMTPPLDNYQSHSIYINEGSEGSGNLWSTLAHEGVPGHMYQFVYFLSQSPEPIRSVLSYNGYQEGWASYVEMMSYEWYDYEEEGFNELERINAALNLLMSARMEIGVNYEGWTLEDTQSYMQNYGFELDDEALQDIMEYMIAEPVNYQMYCVGWLELEDLKEKAQEGLQDDFDETAFHKTILDAGPCPFPLLEKQVEQYMQEAAAEK